MIGSLGEPVDGGGDQVYEGLPVSQTPDSLVHAPLQIVTEGFKQIVGLGLT